jgi:gastric triacylglycerol lipase
VGGLTSKDASLDNYDRYDVLAGHDPAGTSLKNLLHWVQISYSGRFEMYDYGEQMNLKVYGSKLPPEFDLSNIKQR